MAFELNDAINLWFKQVDLTYRFWTYLQVVGAAAVTFAWNQVAQRKNVIIVLVAFILFAIVNGLLVVTTQREAYASARLIRSNWDEQGAWAALSRSFSSWPPVVVGAAHVMIDLGVIVLIGIRL